MPRAFAALATSHATERFRLRQIFERKLKSSSQTASRPGEQASSALGKPSQEL
jgi:hypothetical protein